LTDIYVTSELTGREWTIASLAPGQHSEVFIDNYSVTDLDISEGVITFVYEIEAESPDPDNPEYYDTVEFVSVFEYEEPNPYISIENVIISEPENGYVEGVVTATGTLPSLPYNSNYEEIELNVSEGDIYELCSEY